LQKSAWAIAGYKTVTKQHGARWGNRFLGLIVHALYFNSHFLCSKWWGQQPKEFSKHSTVLINCW